MNATTMDFLCKFTPKLDELFDRELSLVYLNGMNGHLKTFYSDVLAELETKENDMSSKIDGEWWQKADVFFELLLSIFIR